MKYLSLTVISVVVLFLTACKSPSVPEGRIVVKTDPELKQICQDAIQDGTKAKKVAEILGHVRFDRNNFFIERDKLYKEIATLHKNYDSKRSDFEIVLKQFNELEKSHLDYLIKSRRELAELLTNAEWQKLSKEGILTELEVN